MWVIELKKRAKRKRKRKEKNAICMREKGKERKGKERKEGGKKRKPIGSAPELQLLFRSQAFFVFVFLVCLFRSWFVVALFC